MTAVCTRALAVGIAVAAVVAAVVAAAPRASADEIAGPGLVWRSHPVRYPVVPARIRPAAPHVPSSAAVRHGRIALAPDRAAAFWLGSLEVVRLLVRSGDPGDLQIARVAGGQVDGSRAVVTEPRPASAARTIVLTQPPGGGGVWLVAASSPVTIEIQRPVPRSGRLVWELVRDDLIAWVERGGPLPELPVVPGVDALAFRLRADAAVADAFAAAYPHAADIHRALSAWRVASALIALDVARPALSPYVDAARVDTGFGVGATRLARGDRPVRGAPYRITQGARGSWLITVAGPGALRVDARPLLDRAAEPAAGVRDADSDSDRWLSLSVTAGELALGSVSRPARRAPAQRDTLRRAFPDSTPLVDERGVPVGALRSVDVPLLAGTHQYRVSVEGGPALVRVTARRRRPRLAESVAGRADASAYVRRARRQLDRALANAGPAAPRAAAELVRVLIDELSAPTAAPMSAQDAARLPVRLALVEVATRARRALASAEQIAAVAGDCRRLIAAAPREAGEIERWAARTTCAEALARWGHPDRAAAMFAAGTRSPRPAPEVVMARAAEVFGRVRVADMQRHAANAAALAWHARPLHVDRRRAYLATFSDATVWSRAIPARADPRSRPPRGWRWLDTGGDQPRCPPTGPRAFATRGASRGVTVLPLATECPIVVHPAEIGDTRPAELELLVITPNGAPGPIEVAMAGERWSALGLSRIEALSIAAPPGTYPLAVTAPAGSAAFVMAPAPPPEDADTADAREDEDEDDTWPFPPRPPATAPVRPPVVRQWPLAERGVPVAWEIPRTARIGTARIDLRALISGTPGAGRHESGAALGAGVQADTLADVAIRVVSDVGPVAAFRFTAGLPDRDLIPLDAPGLVSTPVAVSVWIPAGATRLWLESDGGVPVVASVSFRRGRDEPPSPDPTASRAGDPGDPDDPGEDDDGADVLDGLDEPPRPRSLESGPLAPPACAGAGTLSSATREPTGRALYEHIHALSTCLLRDPDDAALRLHRARALLEAGRGDHAGGDATAVRAAELTPRARLAYRELIDEIAMWRRSTHLRAQPRPELLARPTPLEPALLALSAPPARLVPLLPVVRTARERGPAIALDQLAKLAPATPSAQPPAVRISDSNTGSPADAPDPVVGYVRARLLARAGQPGAAARELLALFLAERHWQLGVEALELFARELRDAGSSRAAGTASLAYGLASELRGTVSHSAVRRAVALAGDRSYWEPVRGAEAHAGVERLYLVPDDGEVEPASWLAWALIAPPWQRADGHLLRPGQGARAAFELTAPAAVTAELWCRAPDTAWLAQESSEPADDPDASDSPEAPALPEAPDATARGPAAAGDPACTVRARSDARDLGLFTAPSGDVVRVPLGDLQRGAHEVGVLFERARPGVRASVRFVTDRPIGGDSAGGRARATRQPPDRTRTGHPNHRPGTGQQRAAFPLAPRRPARAFRAARGRPVEITVAGPAALLVRVRADAAAPAGKAVAVDHALSTDTQRSVEIVLGAAPDPTVTGDPGRGIRAGEPTAAVLLLAEPGAHRITLQVADGAAFARFAIRRDLGGTPAERALPPRPRDEPDAGEFALFPAPSGPPEFAPSVFTALDRAPEAPGATLSLEFRIGHDTLEENDLSALGVPRIALIGAVRRLVVPRRLWLGADAQLRWSDAGVIAGEDALRWSGIGALATGLTGYAEARRLPLGLGIDANGRVFVQPYDAGFAWAGRVSGAVSRQLRLSPTLAVIPRARLWATHYSLDDVPQPDRRGLDPRVFTTYGRDHHVGVTLATSAYWRPFQDQVGVISSELVTNADLRSVDHIGARLAWRGIAEMLGGALDAPTFELGYRPSLRFDDDHRSRQFVRHDLGVEFDWDVWRNDAGRLVLSVSETLHLSFVHGAVNAVSLSLRWDWTRERGLRDLLPSESLFSDYLEPRLWSAP